MSALSIGDQRAPGSWLLLTLWLPLLTMLLLGALWFLDWRAYMTWVLPERGLLELGHFAISALACFVAVAVVVRARRQHDLLVALWAGFAALSCLYIAGEEISWGQHLIGWDTPEAWRAVNDQGETNLHNTSDWLDQKPRGLLIVGVAVGGIILPLLQRWRPWLLPPRLAVLVPDPVLLPTAVMALVARLPERLHLLHDGRLPWERPSEMEELLLYHFVLIYLLLLLRRLRLRGEGPSS